MGLVYKNSTKILICGLLVGKGFKMILDMVK